MRDKRFIAVHRGGLLSMEHHRQLIKWARGCAEHVFPLLNGNVDERLITALEVADRWRKGEVLTGEAMKASVAVHAAAREYIEPSSIFVARAVGHAVATAHMADHSLGGALYALKALQAAGKSIEEEKEWQLKQLQELPSDIAYLVKATMMKKGKALKLF